MKMYFVIAVYFIMHLCRYVSSMHFCCLCSWDLDPRLNDSSSVVVTSSRMRGDRKDKIFNNTQQLPLKVAAKTKAFLIETVGVQSFKKGYTFFLKEKNGCAHILLEIEKRIMANQA